MGKINEIPAPPSLSENMVSFAKKYVKLRIVDGLSIGDICKELKISTQTFYKWDKIDAFNEYLKALEATYVSADEVDAYNRVRQYILKMVSKDSPSDKHVDMFIKHFSYVVEAENHKRMQQLGINTNATSSNFKTVEERKASLLGRLQSPTMK
ncbi:phBC6A51 family helix-turn-helix protein [Lysinibacillus sp. FSL K6-0057]|uniref:phBC6A51 family helix-turn-helix protein n=1 Tax=Lysinibacillus sp. FSL K6-0057 TaxID=2921411 RepID=UPI003159CF5F